MSNKVFFKLTYSFFEYDIKLRMCHLVEVAGKHAF